MNYNPYAAPQAGGPPQASGPYANTPGGPLPWEIGEVLSTATDVFKNNWLVLVSSLVVTGAVGAVPFVGLYGYVLGTGLRPDGVEMQGGTLLLTIFLLLALTFFQAGLVRIWVSAARGGTPDFGMLFSGGDRYLPLLGLRALLQAPALVGAVLVFAATAAGSPLLVGAANGVRGLMAFAVGVLQALGLFYAEYFVVEKGVGPLAALKQSWEMAGGERGKIFLFAIACFAVLLGATLCCVFPALVAYPLVFVAGAIVFLRSTGNPTAGMAPASPEGGFGPPPGGGYGPPPGGGGYGPPPGGGYGPPPGGGYGPPGR